MGIVDLIVTQVIFISVIVVLFLFFWSVGLGWFWVGRG